MRVAAAVRGPGPGPEPGAVVDNPRAEPINRLRVAAMLERRRRRQPLHQRSSSHPDRQSMADGAFRR